MKHIVRKFIGAVFRLLLMAVLALVFYDTFREPGNEFPYAYYLFSELFIYHLMKALGEACEKENPLSVIRYALFTSSVSIAGIVIANLTGINAYWVLCFLFIGYTLNTAKTYSFIKFVRSQLDGEKSKYEIYRAEKEHRRTYERTLEQR